MKRPRMPILMAGLLAASSAGCGFGGRADKAGGSGAPTVLRLAVASAADESDAPAARFFAARVAALSRGSLRVRVVFDAAGRERVDTEAQVARLVHDGRFELGGIGSRAWDSLGVRSFQALQAPFLVTDYAVLNRIASGPLAGRMLAGLQAKGFVGLALVPDRLRHPIGVWHPLASPSDFAGARVRVRPSRATDSLMRALGATPVHVSAAAIDSAIANHEIDGTEHSLGGSWPGGHYLTANITFFARALTLFASRDTYDHVDTDERAALRRAAYETVRQVVAHPPTESVEVRRYCAGGRVVLASRDELIALVRAAQPVYDQLERDPATKALIAAIRELTTTTPTTPTPAPPACTHDTLLAQGPRVSPSTLNATYRWRLTKAGAIAAGTRADDPDIGNISQMTLRDGKWLAAEAGNSNAEDSDWGTYEIVGNRIIFHSPQLPRTNTFTFSRHANGDLDLKPVLPMDAGDRFEFASAPWRRIGPPLGAP